MDELFEHYWDTTDFHFKYAKGEPSAKGREFHNYDEIVLFISGEATFISKNIAFTLVPGNIVLIPKEHFHQFVITHPQKYERIILGFYETNDTAELIRDVMTEIKIVSTPSESLLAIFEQLKKLSEVCLPEKEKRLILLSSLVQLLTDQKYFFKKAIIETISQSELTRKALSYIDENYNQKLSLSSVSRALGVSGSSLSHHFRNDLNISVYKYIIEKRLSEARKHVEHGLPLCKAAALCGFTDYSAFFRLYKSRYDAKPSDLINKTNFC